MNNVDRKCIGDRDHQCNVVDVFSRMSPAVAYATLNFLDPKILRTLRTNLRRGISRPTIFRYKSQKVQGVNLSYALLS